MIGSAKDPDALRSPARIVVAGLAWSLLWPAILGCVLFLASGGWNWPMAWAYLSMYAFVLAAGSLVIPRSPDFWEERTKIKQGVKAWDKVLAGPLFSVFWFCMYLVAGLDRRFDWPGRFPAAVQAGALIAAGLGYLLSVWAIATNRFYSRYARIQADRGHTVIQTGPYRYVRHPGYAGILLFMLLSPLALNSPWGFLPAGIVAAVMIARTMLEDAMLRDELPGYTEYAKKTRFRLIPGIW